MRKIFLFVILLCWGIVGFTQDGVNFEHLSFKEALDKAQAENKLVFVDCYTFWCGPCRKEIPNKFSNVFECKVTHHIFNRSQFFFSDTVRMQHIIITGRKHKIVRVKMVTFKSLRVPAGLM